MADNPNFEIKITTPAELSGANAVIQSLERQIGSAKASGKAYEEQAEKLAKAKAMVAEYQKAVEAQAEADKKAAQAAAEKTKAVEEAAAKSAQAQQRINDLAKNYSKGSGIGTSDASIGSVKAKADADAAAARLAAIQQQVNASYAAQLFRGGSDVVKKSEDAKKAVENIRQAQTGKVFDELKKSAEAGATAIAASSVSIAGSVGKVWSGMQRLTYLLPGLGMAGLIGMIVAGFTKLAEVLFDTAKEVDTLSDKITTYKEKLNEARSKNLQFAREIDAIRNSTKSAAEKLAEYYRIIDTRKSQKERELDAEKGLELAIAGKIEDPEKRAAKELEIEKRYGRNKTQMENAVIADKFAADRTEVDRRIQENILLNPQKNEVLNQLINAEAAKEAHDKDVKKEKDKADELTKTYERTRYIPGGHTPQDIYGGKQLGEYYDRVAKAASAVAMQAKTVRDLEVVSRLNADKVQAYTDALESLKNKIKENEAFIKDKNDSLKDDIARNKAAADTNTKIQNIDEQTRAIKTQSEIDKTNREEQKKKNEEVKRQQEKDLDFKREMQLKSMGSPSDKIESVYGSSSIYSGAGSTPPPTKPPGKNSNWRRPTARELNMVIAAEKREADARQLNEAIKQGLDWGKDTFNPGIEQIGDSLGKFSDAINQKIDDGYESLKRKIDAITTKVNYPNSRLPGGG